MRKLKTKKISKIQIARMLALISVILFFIFVPLSNWYANNKAAYNHAHLVELAEGPTMGFIYKSLDLLYTQFKDPVTAATSNNGSLWAYTVMGIPISDPLGLIAELLNSVKFPLKYLIGGLIPFLVILLLGRFFCAWLCPMTVLFGITKRIRSLMTKIGIPLMGLKLELRTRVVVFWGGMLLSHFFGAWVWHFVLPYISFTHEAFSIIVFSSFTAGIYFLIAFLVLDIGLIPGEYCRSICPTGFLLSYLGQYSVFKLKADRPNCPKGCLICFDVCPIGLYPKMDKLYSCHLCMKCVDACPSQHIALGLNPTYERFFAKPQTRLEEQNEMA